ncbi:MAG: hypothetical protein IPN33_02000 [Saprospiraceae bacterium]|nr:hypothetical protein [Saprospiraceae bacterium]
MKETKNEKELEKNHRRYMEKAKAGIGGFSEKTYPIQSSLLYQGILGALPVHFAGRARRAKATGSSSSAKSRRISPRDGPHAR